MATFNVPGTQITANVLRTSPGFTHGSNYSRARITLVDTNNQWGNTPDNSRHVIEWGLQISHDNGTNWDWGPVSQEEPGGLPFGSRDRSGGMPSLFIESSTGIGGPTDQIRLAMLTDANIRLGAQILTGTDA